MEHNISSMASLAADNVPSHELQALQDFYDSTAGNDWTWNATLGNQWNFSAVANPCVDAWQGITCNISASPYHVIAITLQKMNLLGYLPDSLGWLTALISINLPDNYITGTLPQTLANLTSMEVFVITSNNLAEGLPDYLSTWSGLRYLALDANRFTSTIPESYCQLTHLLQFNLEENYLEGDIPDCFANMTRLVDFAVQFNQLEGTLPLSLAVVPDLLTIRAHDNFLTGTIPEVYGKLIQVLVINIYQNLLTGTVPQSFNALPNMVQLLVGENLLTGTIPSFIGTMTQLQVLDLSGNFMNGTLPNNLGDLVNMQRMYMYSNKYTGTLPASLGNCTQIGYFGFYNNRLTGTIPATLSSLIILEYLEVNNNLLSGPIPDMFTHMPYMYTLDVSDNSLSGPLPQSMRNLSYIAYIIAQQNLLTGSFPTGLFDHCPLLYSFETDANYLTGQIPASIGSLGYLDYFNIADNAFTGSIPDALGNLNYLQFIYLSENHLTGTIPESLAQLPYIELYYMDHNMLHGTLPAGIGSMTYLQFVNMAVNLLTGTLPSTFSQCAYLIELVLNNNHLTGPLEQAFNASMQYAMATVALNSNRFSGTLPSEAFRLYNLNSFSAVSNCFHGQLPEVICNSTTLVTLALDGLSSARSCRNTLFPGLSSSYVVTRSLSGTVPTCLFHMPKLTTLHLSGNGLTGTLPVDHINPFLIDLSLSHNTLTGTIPEYMQRRDWYNLDLSYNRLSGTLLSDFQSEVLNATFYSHLSDLIGLNISQENAQSSLSLENNRLSGRIPSTVQHKANVSVLGSNLFTCNLEGTNLPHNDIGKYNYQCDSQEFNVPFYIWLSVVAAFLTGALLVWRFQDKIVQRFGIDYELGQINKWFRVLEVHAATIDPARRLPAYVVVLKLSEDICKVALYCTVYILVVLLPVVTANSAYFGTFTHQYAWVASAAYTSGVVPGALTMTFLSGLVVLIVFTFSRLIPPPTGTQETAKSSVPAHNVLLIYATFIAVNLTAVGGANFAYVYVAINGKREVLLLAQVMLSLFKLVWNRFFSVLLIRWTAELFTVAIAANADTEANILTKPPELQLVSLQVFVALFNNIVIPCVMVVVVSPDCFYDVLVGAPKVDTYYTYQYCAEIDGSQCIAYHEGDSRTSYDPPFTYNYQCSSSFITYYAPAFVLLCMMRTFLTPVLQYVLYVLHRRALTQPDGYWYKLLDMLIPANLKPIEADDALTPSLYKPYFDANQMVLSLITYMGLLLTFGAVFPPVAVALFVTLLSVLYFNRLKLGRYLSIAAEKGLFAYVDIIEIESKRAGFMPVLEKSLWMLITISCWFYTLFLFDTLGDAVGFGGAYWVLIVMPMMPLVLYAVYHAYKRMLVQVICHATTITENTGDFHRKEAEHGDTFNAILNREL